MIFYRENTGTDGEIVKCYQILKETKERALELFRAHMANESVSVDARWEVFEKHSRLLPYYKGEVDVLSLFNGVELPQYPCYRVDLWLSRGEQVGFMDIFWGFDPTDKCDVDLRELYGTKNIDKELVCQALKKNIIANGYGGFKID